jgi:drug/metabolite transporter (DMT)-like permease
LFLLSLLWAATVLRGDLLPVLASTHMPRLERQVLPLVPLAIVAGAIALSQSVRWPQRRQLWSCTLVGLGLFAVPALLIDFSESRVPAFARTALLTLVPVFAVVFEPYIGKSSQRRVSGGLLATLSGVTAALFIFPVSMPNSAGSALGFAGVIAAAASVAASNCLGVALVAQLDVQSAGRRSSVAAIAAIAAATAAIVLAMASLIFEQPLWNWNIVTPEWTWSAAIETPATFLLFWLMPRMSATRMATRYLLAPLLAIIIGVILLRSVQDVHPRTWLGLSLMAASAAWLLFGPNESAGLSTSPLDLGRK